MGSHDYYMPSEEEIAEMCERIRAERSPDVKLPIHFDGFVQLYCNHSDFIQEQAEKDGMPVDEMRKDEIRFIFYLINRSLGSAENFRCSECDAINDGFSKLCQKCSYQKSAERKRRRRKLEP